MSTRVQRFVVLGVVNSAFGFAAFAAVQLAFGRFLHYLLVLALAHVAAVLEAFAVQRRFVFRSIEPWLPELARFWSVYLGIFALNIPVLLLSVEVVHLPVLVAQFVTLLILAVGSYLLHRSFTFSSPKSAEAAAAESAIETTPRPQTRRHS
jgi:putative flippase GtrA